MTTGSIAPTAERQNLGYIRLLGGKSGVSSICSLHLCYYIEADQKYSRRCNTRFIPPDKTEVKELQDDLVQDHEALFFRHVQKVEVEVSYI